MPEIPEHLSNDAKNFIMLCLQRDPSARPTAHKLLEHPFIRDQSATKAATRDVSSYMFDGSRTPVKCLALFVFFENFALLFHSNHGYK
jgi:serine/threonine protein kinase